MSSTQPRPWIRYLARYIDMALYTVIIIMIFVASIFILRYLGKDINVITSMPKIVFSAIFLFLLIIIEILVFHHWGTTAGKKLLKIHISKNNETTISYYEATLRTIKVWVFGLGLGIPLISLFTQISAFNKLSSNGITSWDKEGEFTIRHDDVDTWRIVLALMIVLVMLISYVKFSR